MPQRDKAWPHRWGSRVSLSLPPRPDHATGPGNFRLGTDPPGRVARARAGRQSAKAGSTLQARRSGPADRDRGTAHRSAVKPGPGPRGEVEGVEARGGCRPAGQRPEGKGDPPPLSRRQDCKAPPRHCAGRPDGPTRSQVVNRAAESDDPARRRHTPPAQKKAPLRGASSFVRCRVGAAQFVTGISRQFKRRSVPEPPNTPGGAFSSPLSLPPIRRGMPSTEKKRRSVTTPAIAVE
jgi:hypothetical protein